METLTVTLARGKLTFDRSVFLGSTYAAAFAGEAAGMDGLTLRLTGRSDRISLATTVPDGEGGFAIAFDTRELIGEFRGCPDETAAFDAWLSGPPGTAGKGVARVRWSPLVADIIPGEAMPIKGDTGNGIASVTREPGMPAVITYTDGATQELDVSDLKGDKGEAGSVLNHEAAALLVAALTDGEPSNIGQIYEQIAAIKAILKAMQ